MPAAGSPTVATTKQANYCENRSNYESTIVSEAEGPRRSMESEDVSFLPWPVRSQKSWLPADSVEIAISIRLI